MKTTELTFYGIAVFLISPIFFKYRNSFAQILSENQFVKI